MIKGTMKIGAAAFLCMSWVSTVSAASIAEIDKNILIIAVSPVSDFRSITRKKRTSIAQLLQSYWAAFDSAIPRNLPSEQSWLEKELSSNNGERLTRAINTHLYARWQLANRSEQCLKDSGVLLDQVGASKEWELYAWIRMMGCYNDPYGMMQQLQTAGVSNGRYDGPLPMLHSSSLLQLIAGPIANAVISGEANVFAPSTNAP